jgi:hypothetical protein
MKMLLATAAFVTLLASDALAQSRWRSAYVLREYTNEQVTWTCWL